MKVSFLHAFPLILLCCAIQSSMVSCDNVHQFPDEDVLDDSKSKDTSDIMITETLHLVYNDSLPLYKVVPYTRADEGYRVHYVIKAYRGDEILKDSSAKPDTVFSFTSPLSSGLDKDVTLKLKEGTYHFYVWTDYVIAVAPADNYFRTSAFEDVSYIDHDPYIGNNDNKDSFWGYQQIEVQKSDGMSEGGVYYDEDTIYCGRASAKYEFVSDDLKAFTRKVLEKRSKLSDKGEIVDANVHISSYRVKLYYTGYMPSSFNLYTGNPADAWQGISFDGHIEKIDDENVILGFDFVFAQDEDAKIDVAIEVFDEDDKSIGVAGPLTIPLKRGMLTIIKGPFLTSITDGTINIDNGYDGEYNIEIM